MEVRPQTISQFSYPRRFVRGLASRSMAPLILLECFVTGGRTVQAYQRGGFEEARERFTEETIGALFWFAGVKMFNKMNDWIGKKILKLHTANFDAQEDGVRKPLKNFLYDDKQLKAQAKLAGKTGKLIKNLTKEQIAVFKALKIGSSIILANVLVGLVVPKINQHITAVYHEKHFGQNKENKDNLSNTHQMNYGQIKMDKFLKSEDNKNIPFGMNYNALLSIANKFENDATYQLLSTDVGIAGGRAVSSRNKHERTEVLFRDLTSIYFYMFSMPNINRWLNQIEDGRKTRLDPVAAKQVTDHLEAVLKENGGKMDVESFARAAIGDNSNVGFIDRDLIRKFDEHKVITLDEFKSYLKQTKQFTDKDISKYTNLAERMSKLQPEVEGVSVLTKNQVKDIFREGAINMPEFLQNVFSVATKNASTDKYSYVNYEKLTELKEDIFQYVSKIIEKARKNKTEITSQVLEKASRENFIKNTCNWSVGFAISALFLSTLIPKIQYWITRITTGKDNFPGTADYSNDHKKNENKLFKRKK